MRPLARAARPVRSRGGRPEQVVENVRTMISMVPQHFAVTIALMNHKDQRLTRGAPPRCPSGSTHRPQSRRDLCHGSPTR
jgi:hypothetical protein